MIGWATPAAIESYFPFRPGAYVYFPVTGSLVPSLPVYGFALPLIDQLSLFDLFGSVACDGAT